MAPAKRSESTSTLVREQQQNSSTVALANTGDNAGCKERRSSSLRQNQLQVQQQPTKSHRHKGCCGSPYHLNSVWSVWYGLCISLFTGYLVYCSIKRFLYYASLPWREEDLPLVELNAFVGLVGSSVVVLPFFLITSILKVGNLANDGFKLGASLSTCSRNLPPVLEPSHGLIRSLFLHGLPTAAFLHLVVAFCLLIPRTIMDATLVSHSLLPQEYIWHSDIDFLFHDILHTYKEFPPNMKLAFEEPENPSQSISIEKDQKLIKTTESIQPQTNEINGVLNHLITPPTSPKDGILENENTQKIRISRDTSERNSSKFQNTLDKESITPLASSKNEVGRTENTEIAEAPFKEIVSNPGLLRHFTSQEDPKSFMETKISEDALWFTTSLEFVNYAIALIVFAIRYPSVYWHTNKGFALLFSFQLIANALYSIILLMAYTIMYKVQASGEISVVLEDEVLLLSLPATVTLQIVAMLIITVSASTIYFYGYQKFSEFMIKSRQRYHISYSKATPILSSWSPHCCILIALTTLCLANGPLLWDMMHLYRKSSHNVLLAAIMLSIAHMLSWVLLWIILGFKSTWIFKLRVTVARACVSNARSIKLINDVELSSWNENNNSLIPLLIVGGGRAYAISDSQPRKKIMAVIHKTQEEKRARGEEEDIYWLRPNQTQQCQNKPLSPKPKVTFEEDPKRTGNGRYSEKQYSRVSKSNPQLTSTSETDEDEDDNRDYAPLKKASATAKMITANHNDNRRYSELKKNIRHYRSTENYYSEDQKSISSISPLPKRHESKIGSPASIGSRDSRMSQEEQRWHRSNSIASSCDHQPHFSEDTGVQVNVNDLMHNRSTSVDDLTMLPPDPNLLMVSQRCMSLQRPISTLDGSSHHPISSLDTSLPINVINSTPVLYPADEETLVIRRPRNTVQEVKPPLDPIYGTRSLSSFTSRRQSSGIRGSTGSQGQPRESFYGSRSQENCLDYETNSQQPRENVYGIQIHPSENVYTTKSQANENSYESQVHSSLYEPHRRGSQRHNKHLMCEGQGTHTSRRSTGSSGYHSGANGSSASNSSSNSPVPPPPVIQNTRQKMYAENSQIKQDVYGQIANLTTNINNTLNSNNPYMKHNMYEHIPNSNSNISLSNSFNNPHLKQDIYGQVDSRTLERNGTRNSHIFTGHISNQPLPETPDLPLPPLPQELLAQDTVEQPRPFSSCYDIYGRTTGQKIYR